MESCIIFLLSFFVLLDSNLSYGSVNITDNAGDGNNQINTVLLSGLGASLGGAIAGGFFGSFLQAYYSNRSSLEKDHLGELKDTICNPLSQIISNPNFTISDLHNVIEVISSSSGVIKIKSSNLLLIDFMENHYPEVYHNLKECIKVKRDIDDKEHYIHSKLKSSLSGTFSSLQTGQEKEVFNDVSLDTLAKAIINDSYDNSYLRMTEYSQYRYLYFYTKYCF